jgi:wyosine [tRNA(Phe)-imidazoG37] synthetase (radical SAM superfamily)
VSVIANELEKTLLLVDSGEIRQKPHYARLNEDLLRLRHVAFSGDGEPTLCPEFIKAVEAVVHVRARRLAGYFKLVLSTNGTLLDWPEVQEGLQYFTRNDEIWIKLDAGTQGHMNQINRGATPLEKVLQNALALGRRRPIVIQSLFPLVDGRGPAAENIDEYIRCLNRLKDEGATISTVQIFSATQCRKTPGCGHLPLQTLRDISSRVRAETGLKPEVF